MAGIFRPDEDMLMKASRERDMIKDGDPNSPTFGQMVPDPSKMGASFAPITVNQDPFKRTRDAMGMREPASQPSEPLKPTGDLMKEEIAREYQRLSEEPSTPENEALKRKLQENYYRGLK